MRPADLTLYLIIGPGDTRGRPMKDVILAAILGGVTAVQLRWKDHNARDFVEEARALVQVLRPLGIPMIVNDRVDIAVAADADGVHVGQDDLPIADVRRIVPDRMLVGLSITSEHDAERLDPALVDYAGVGPVFGTPSKADATQPMGLSGTRRVVERLTVPSVAIGGITRDNAGDVMATGVVGISVISAICGADNPERAAAELSASVRGRGRRQGAAGRDWPGARGAPGVGGSG